MGLPKTNETKRPAGLLIARSLNGEREAGFDQSIADFLRSLMLIVALSACSISSRGYDCRESIDN
jgi:hypothetical protein